MSEWSGLWIFSRVRSLPNGLVDDVLGGSLRTKEGGERHTPLTPRIKPSRPPIAEGSAPQLSALLAKDGTTPESEQALQKFFERIGKQATDNLKSQIQEDSAKPPTGPAFLG